MVDGESGTIFYSTSFLLNNPSNLVTSVTIRFFRSDGTAWMVDLQSFDRSELAGKVSSRTFNLQPRETVELFTGGVDPLPLDGPRSIQRVPSRHPRSLESSIRARYFFVPRRACCPRPQRRCTPFIPRVSTNEPAMGTNIDTGVAIANLSGAQADGHGDIA